MDDGCVQIGTGGNHSDSYYDDQPCEWCGESEGQTLEKVNDKATPKNQKRGNGGK